MTDLFSIGSSALLSYRRALDTVGHNVANVDTPGYSRQRVELSTRTPTPSGQGVYGNGVYANTVVRNASDLVQQRLIGDASQVGYFSMQTEVANRLDGLLSDDSLSVGTGLDQFFTAAETLAADPNSTAARQSLLAAGQDLTRRVGSLAYQFDTLERDLGFEMTAAIGSANDLSAEIATLNEQITLAMGRSGGQPPNDLLDTRDELVRNLAGQLDIRTVATESGELNVFAQSGQALVLGVNAYALTAVDDPLGSLVPQVGVETDGGVVNISRQVGGGQIGGILATTDLLADTRGQVAQLALGVSEQFNALHATGVTPTGQPGGQVFTAAAIDVSSHVANTGSASLAVSVTAAGNVPANDPELRFDGTQWLRVDGGATVALTGSGAAGDPIELDGLSIVVSGTPATNDRFRVGIGDALDDFGMALSDPAGLATAGAVVVEAASANTGTLMLEGYAVDDASVPGYGTAATLSFPSSSQVSIDGGPAVAYDPAAGVLVNGLRLQFSGAPQAGNVIELSATGGGSADNRTAQAFAGLAGSSFLGNGSEAPAEAAARLISTLGNAAATAEAGYSGALTIQSADLADRDAQSGVNLDEEAANLMRFEQAYQAAAQVMSVASTLFETLLSAVRR
ncbi:MAG: flagellar hook-associated protein FlgK [Abyssibacter sp.]|uniref:flagellar hook-associated protein FlgK n=1 Tax=Abyssibacter sp. TaxID=2320200 RepID=UPI0032192AFD